VSNTLQKDNILDMSERIFLFVDFIEVIVMFLLKYETVSDVDLLDVIRNIE